MTIAAPLILVGAPLLPLLRGISGSVSQSDMVTTGRRALWLEHHLTYPVFCWFAGTAAVTGWHLPAAFQLAMRSHWAHGIEDACFLLAGLLFWRPVVQILTN